MSTKLSDYPSTVFATKITQVPEDIRELVVEYLDETWHGLGNEEPCDLFQCDDWTAIVEDLMDAIRARTREGRTGLDLTLVGEDFGRYLDAI